LPGFRAFLPEGQRLRRAVFARLHETARRFGFEEYDGPVLESLDLYTEKSGEEIVGQLFWFEDRGGRSVALRPEMTPTLARLAGASASSLAKPVRWYSLNEQYRFERPQKGRQRAFTQWNLDILGESSPGADAEVIACLLAGLRSFGLGEADLAVRLSDRRVWNRVLELLAVPAEKHPGLLALVDRMERQSEEERGEAAAALLGSGAVEVLGRVAELRTVRGDADLAAFLDSLATDAAAREANAELLARWSALRGAVRALGLDPFVRVDFGIVRGLAYYTGPVFEIFEASGTGRALAGGGRYDDLVGRVSGHPMEAVGGALGDVTLLDLLEERDCLPPAARAVDGYLAIAAEEAREEALALATELRAAGLSVLYPFRRANFGKLFKEANRCGARAVIPIGDRELESGIFPVRDMETGAEETVPRADLVTYLGQLCGRSPARGQ
jgi:histidyl-tRNA synthetase